MTARELLLKLVGFYVLAPNGAIGYVSEDGRLLVDGGLSAVFADHNKQYLKDYLSDPEALKYRTSVIFETLGEQAWSTPTLHLETDIFCEIFHLSDTSELTGFQKKNRKKSVYQGMELLLDYQNESFPGTPIYCPVIFDRNTRISNYSFFQELKSTAYSGSEPVLEVLNLIASVPISARSHKKEIGQLKRKISDGIIKKEKRKGGEFGIRNRIGDASGNILGEAYGEVDSRSKNDTSLESLREKDPHNLEKWRTNPIEYIDVNGLRHLYTFVEVNIDVLEEFAATCVIFSASAGASLLQRGKSDNGTFFLIEGKVQLQAADGKQSFLESGSENARSPVSHLKPRMFTVNAMTPVKFLWIHDAEVERLVKTKRF